MITQSLRLIIGSFFLSAPPLVSAECEEFAARAHFLDATWEQCDHRDEALVVLAMVPPNACAPAERFVLAKRAIDVAEASSPLVRILLHQGIREHRYGANTLVNLVAQVDLLEHMVQRNLIRLSREERLRLRSLSNRIDTLIERRPTDGVGALFAEYHALASLVLNRAAGRPIPRR